jgi:hypothetical protein
MDIVRVLGAHALGDSGQFIHRQYTGPRGFIRWGISGILSSTIFIFEVDDLADTRVAGNNLLADPQVRMILLRWRLICKFIQGENPLPLADAPEQDTSTIAPV